jgi:hypothetical protein
MKPRGQKEQETANAQIKMKALVVSRLLLGDFADWQTFENERGTASKILNRTIARNVSSQIGRTYRDLSIETRKFIEQNFVGCEYRDLAHLCDEVRPGIGLSMRLDEFERAFFPLADSVKQRFPFYAQVNISTYGLRFEFPEHHFLRDIEVSLPELLDIQSSMEPFKKSAASARLDHELIGRLVAREKFISRSIVSAAFSLVEAFLSGLFFTAVQTQSFGSLGCDEEFLRYAATKESAALADRLGRIVQFASRGAGSGTDEPFGTFIKVGKRYRDAIHHTTPFQRKDIEAGGRLIALYEIGGDIALLCILLSCETVLKVCHWAYGAADTTDIASRCSALLQTVKAAPALRGAA